MSNPFEPDDPHFEHWERVDQPRPRPDPNAEMSQRAIELQHRLLNSAALSSIPKPVPLIDHVLYDSSVAWLQGRPGEAKSFVAIDMAGCLGTGENWQGNWVIGPHRVLYVVAEGSSGLESRVRAWEAAMGRPMTGVVFLPVPVQASSPADWDALVEVCVHGEIQVIILDTQARLTVGMEENSARDMGIWVAQLERLCAATRACVIVVHHQGRTGEHMRGSTAMEGAATTVIQVSKEDEAVTVRCLKQKDATKFEDIRLRLVPFEDSAVLSVTDAHQPVSTVVACRRWLTGWREVHGDEWVSVTTLIASEVVSKSTFHRSKMALLTERAIERKGEGNAVRYRVLWSEGSESHGPTPKGVVGPWDRSPESHGSPTGAWDS